MNKLPDFEALAIFAKVAETGSFAKTAAALGCSQATVSKAISRLEARLETVLFHRTPRQMSLTESGRRSLQRAALILAEGVALEEEINEQSTTPRGLVRIAAPMSFGVAHLAPVIPDFMQRYPEITLDVTFDDKIVDLVAEGFDVALRISTLADSSLLARRLCSVRILLVGSPAYFERYGRPQHPRELAAHRTLCYAYSRFGNAWRFEHERHGHYSISPPSLLRVNNAEALGAALLAGLGLALQPEFLVWHELQQGKLQTVMPAWVPPPIAVHIVTPPNRMRPTRVKAVIDYLVQRFENAPWAQSE